MKLRAKNKHGEMARKVRAIADDVRGDEGRALLLAVARDYERAAGTSRRNQSKRFNNIAKKRATKSN